MTHGRLTREDRPRIASLAALLYEQGQWTAAHRRPEIETGGVLWGAPRQFRNELAATKSQRTKCSRLAPRVGPALAERVPHTVLSGSSKLPRQRWQRKRL